MHKLADNLVIGKRKKKNVHHVALSSVYHFLLPFGLVSCENMAYNIHLSFNSRKELFPFPGDLILKSSPFAIIFQEDNIRSMAKH